MIALVICSAIFLLAPWIYRMAFNFSKIYSIFHFSIRTLIGYSVLFHIIPECFTAIPNEKSTLSILVVIGFFVVGLGEVYHSKHSHSSLAMRIPLLMGIYFHIFLDGMGLFISEHHHGVEGHHSHLSWAIILHRIPFACLLWEVLRSRYDFKKSYIFMILGSVFTLLGHYFPEGQLWKNVYTLLIYFQALIAGSLLHFLAEPLLHYHKEKKA